MRVLPVAAVDFPKLRQTPAREVCGNIIEEAAGDAAAGIGRTELKPPPPNRASSRGQGPRVKITTEISKRDPYARETILPTQSLSLNPQQVRALEKIIAALDGKDELEKSALVETSRPLTPAPPETPSSSLRAPSPHWGRRMR